MSVTKSDEGKGYTLYPTTSLPTFLGAGFYVQVSIQILHLYGGWTRPWAESADWSPLSIYADYQQTYPSGQGLFNSFYNSPYATFETLLEVVAFVVATSDVLFQASFQRAPYAATRAAAQLQLYGLLCGLFGFEPQKQVELDQVIVEHGQRYVPDLRLGVELFGNVMNGLVVADSVAFSNAAHAYTVISHRETFSRVLLYTKGFLGAWTLTCSQCRHNIKGRKIHSVDRVSCGNCGSVFSVSQAYE